jgi:AcrR family transcriptional regulator
MARRTDTPAEPRTPLSKERVLRAAVAVADEGGIESLSMRKLAAELGVKAMSLYNHVANKDEVLDGILEAVANEIVLASGEPEWKAAIRNSAVSAHETLLRHPWAGSLWMQQKPGPAQLRYFDSLLGTLRDAGFSEDLTYHAYHILQSHIIGFTLQVLNYRAIATQDLADLAASFLREFSTEEYPHFTEHVRQHMEPRHDEENAFELGLNLILDGLERMRDAV